MRGQQIFKAIVGSQAYGTNTPTSDIDYKGVYCQSEDALLGFGYSEQYEIGKDETHYEVRRFIQLLQTANPTVLELLYSPEDCIIEKHPVFELLILHRDKFLTKKCLNSFGGYAIQQIQKAKGLDKKMNWEGQRVERKTLLDFCHVYVEGKTYSLMEFMKKEDLDQEHCGLVKLDHFRDCYCIHYDYQFKYGAASNRILQPLGYKGMVGEDSNSLRVSEVPKYSMPVALMFWNKDAYTIHCRDYQQYQTWLANRNTQRYVETKNHNQKIDGKNLLHCRRLLDVAYEIATQKTINVRRPNKAYLLSIRKGECNLDDIISKAEEDIKLLDGAFANSGLPDDVDKPFCNELLLEIRKLLKKDLVSPE